MAETPKFTRPTFSEPLASWKTLLSQRELPSELVWIFDENLCFEEDARGTGRFKPGFQLSFTPPPPEAEQITYEHFCEFDAPIIFYRIGSWRQKSVCLMLCDKWFEPKGEKDGFIRKDEWGIAFRPGEKDDVEEITSQARWQKRILRNRPLHDLDFCMTLQAVHEILAHGRVLTTYEHYALKLLDAWRRLLTQSE